MHGKLRGKAKRMKETPNPQDLRSPNRRPGWGEAQHGVPRSPDPRVPSAQPAPVGSTAARGTEAAGAGTPRSLASPALARRGSPAAPGRTGQPAPYLNSPGAPRSLLPPSRRGVPWSTYPHTAPSLRLLAAVPRRPQRRAHTRKGRSQEERKNPPIQSGSLFILKLQSEPRTPPC